MFVKFPKITNIDLITEIQRKQIEHINHWVVTEKIDGSNFSIIVNNQTREFDVARRNDVIENVQGDICGLFEGRDRFNDIVDKLIDAYGNDHQYTIVYGEWFGPKILRRINYGTINQWRLFALSFVDDDIVYPQPFKDLHDFMLNNHMIDNLVPVIAHIEDLDQFAKFANDESSRLSPSSDVEEGIVAAAWDIGSDIRFKNKNNKFTERSNVVRTTEVFDKHVQDAKAVLKQYYNENRMLSVISKLGVPKDRRNFSNYIREFVNDGFEDFALQHPNLIQNLSNAEKKALTNFKSYPLQILTDVINKYYNIKL